MGRGSKAIVGLGIMFVSTLINLASLIWGVIILLMYLKDDIEIIKIVGPCIGFFGSIITMVVGMIMTMSDW